MMRSLCGVSMLPLMYSLLLLYFTCVQNEIVSIGQMMALTSPVPFHVHDEFKMSNVFKLKQKYDVHIKQQNIYLFPSQNTTLIFFLNFTLVKRLKRVPLSTQVKILRLVKTKKLYSKYFSQSFHRKNYLQGFYFSF